MRRNGDYVVPIQDAVQSRTVRAAPVEMEIEQDVIDIPEAAVTRSQVIRTEKT